MEVIARTLFVALLPSSQRFFGSRLTNKESGCYSTRTALLAMRAPRAH